MFVSGVSLRLSFPRALQSSKGHGSVIQPFRVICVGLKRLVRMALSFNVDFSATQAGRAMHENVAINGLSQKCHEEPGLR